MLRIQGQGIERLARAGPHRGGYELNFVDVDPGLLESLAINRDDRLDMFAAGHFRDDSDRLFGFDENPLHEGAAGGTIYLDLFVFPQDPVEGAA